MNRDNEDLCQDIFKIRPENSGSFCLFMQMYGVVVVHVETKKDEDRSGYYNEVLVEGRECRLKMLRNSTRHLQFLRAV